MTYDDVRRMALSRRLEGITELQVRDAQFDEIVAAVPEKIRYKDVKLAEAGVENLSVGGLTFIKGLA